MMDATLHGVRRMLPKRPRLHSFDYLGKYRYFLTLATHNRAEYFTDGAVVALALEHILRSAQPCKIAISLYCFMPEHLHLLVEGLTDDADLRDFVKRAKQSSGFAYSKQHQKRLWQPSYYDHVLRHDESSLYFIAYILRNPVEAQLVSTFSEYPFLGSATTPLGVLADMLSEGLGPRWETEGLIEWDEAGLKACAALTTRQA